MENKKESTSTSLLTKIKSKFIFESIFTYIKDEKFKLKLIIKSKLFQKILNIGLIDYQNQYISKLNLNPENYLSFYNKSDIDYLKRNWKIDLSKYKIDINVYEKYIVNYYKKRFNNNQKSHKNIKNKDYIITIYSPIFDCLSKSDIFEYFNIEIPLDVINKKNLKSDYISIFDKLNEQNSKYSSLYYYFEDINDINEFKININTSQIKRLKLEQIFKDKYNNEFNTNKNSENKKIEKNEQINFFSNFLSYKNFGNNLLYLNFILKERNYKIDSNLFSNINNFKLLEELKLTNFNFDQTFILNLYNLKILSIISCKNITFSENTFLNLEELELIFNEIEKPTSLLKLPKLKKLFLENKPSKQTRLSLRVLLVVIKGKTTDYNSIIDFESLQKLNSLKIDTNSLKYFKDISCENLGILDSSNELEKEKEMLEKILLMKGKNLSFYLNKINANDISNIKGINTTVSNLTIYLENDNYNCINLLNKFQNLTNLVIKEKQHENMFHRYCHHSPTYSKSEIRIKENPNCKINRFSVEINQNIEFYCRAYETLVDIDINITGEIKYKNTYNTFSNIIPLFSNNCNIIFKSLASFQFSYKNQIDFSILENIYNNIDNMPNLKSFTFICYSVKNNEDFYKKFIKKLLLMKLDKVKLIIDKYSCGSNIYYSKKELMEICDSTNIYNLDNVEIAKINEYKKYYNY